MGVIKKGILGGFSGIVGQVIGGTWKGIDYMRSQPSSVANPRTTAQTNQRTKFKGCTQFFSNFLGSLIQVFWNGLKPQMSGYNDIVQTNIVNFDNSGNPTYSDLVISKGSLIGINPTSIVATASSDGVEIDWSDNSGVGNGLATDTLCLAVYNETQDKYFASVVGFSRDTENGVAVVPGIEAGDELHVYVFMCRLNNPKFASVSYYELVTAV